MPLIAENISFDVCASYNISKSMYTLVRLRLLRRDASRITKGGSFVARKGSMSEGLKQVIAQELGVNEEVARNGWGAVSSRDCGRMVQKAIEIAEKAMAAK
jgi:small acid-soluble spore protein F (minor alpha/beta-type SASP)